MTGKTKNGSKKEKKNYGTSLATISCSSNFIFLSIKIIDPSFIVTSNFFFLLCHSILISNSYIYPLFPPTTNSSFFLINPYSLEILVSLSLSLSHTQIHVKNRTNGQRMQLIGAIYFDRHMCLFFYNSCVTINLKSEEKNSVEENDTEP